MDIREGLNVIITGGTGMLPFLDLFDLLLKKAIFSAARLENVEKQDEFNIYHANYS